jgi:uncharacterized membrane protein
MTEAGLGAAPTRNAGGLAAGDAPRVRVISVGDVRDALAKGVDDFRAMPRHVMFLGVIYALLGLMLVMLTFNYRMIPLIFPLISGFALLGPVAATGLYELSRRREQGLDTSWWHMFGVLGTAAARPILILGLALLAVFLVWLDVAFGIYGATFGDAVLGPGEFLGRLFTTAHGWALIVLGVGAGAFFALAVFATTVVSFPMLVDRRVSVATAVGTSVRAVAANPRPMAAWALIVAAALAVGCVPLFVGLAVALPVLGHATWHLYRKVVES